MNVYSTDKLRNIALVSHQGAGKTSLVEALLFNSGATNRLGDIASGTTVADFDEEEIRRGLSLSTSLIPIEHAGLKFNFLDTPGYTDFQGEVKNTLYVAEMALLLVDASAGVEVGTELVWNYADETNLPRIVVINKMDRDVARPEQVLDELKSRFSANFVPLQVPMGERGDFPGIIDLLKMKACLGVDGNEDDIPGNMADSSEGARTFLVEASAEADDALLEKYFDAGDLTPEEIWDGLKIGFLANTIVPVIYTSGTANTGVKVLIELLTALAPDPTRRQAFGAQDSLTAEDSKPLALYIFKTTADPYVGRLTYLRVVSGILKADTRYFNPAQDEEERFGSLYVMRGKEQLQVDTMHAGDIGAVAKLNHTVTGDTICNKDHLVTISQPTFPQPVYAVAVSPETQVDSAKMGPTLTRLCDEDPTLNWRQDPATKEAVLEGMGDVHVDVAIRRAGKLGVNLLTAVPKVPYQETVTKTFGTQYRHKKQTGGAGQFAEVHLRVEPLPRGEGFEYTSEVFGGAISSSYIPSIEKGIKQVLEQGVIAGYPVVDVKAVVFDGKEHPVDSKDIAFQIAGREVFKLAVRGAGPALLEPIVEIQITVPDSNMGDVMGDLSSRRAQIQGTDSERGKSIITALVPLAEVQRYSNDLRSFTQGRGVYTMKFSHYQEAPAHVAGEIVEKAKRKAEEE